MSSSLFETERLIVRPLLLSDLDDLFEIFSDPEVMRYYPSVKSRAGAEDWIRKNTGRYDKDGYGLWALVAKDTGDFVGECGITVQAIDGIAEDEIGYHVKRKYWNQGYATEAALATAEYGFTVLKMRRQVCWTVPANLASRRVAEKIGMTLAKETLNSRGAAVVVYEISDEQWRGRREERVKTQP